MMLELEGAPDEVNYRIGKFNMTGFFYEHLAEGYSLETVIKERRENLKYRLNYLHEAGTAFGNGLQAAFDECVQYFTEEDPISGEGIQRYLLISCDSTYPTGGYDLYLSTYFHYAPDEVIVSIYDCYTAEVISGKLLVYEADAEVSDGVDLSRICFVLSCVFDGKEDIPASPTKLPYHIYVIRGQTSISALEVYEKQKAQRPDAQAIIKQLQTDRNKRVKRVIQDERLRRGIDIPKSRHNKDAVANPAISKSEELKQGLVALGSLEGAKQAARFQSKLGNLNRLLADKFNPSELTCQRYHGLAKEVYLSGIDNLRSVISVLKSIREMDDGDIKQRQLDKVKHLLLENEQALRQLDETTVAISNMDTGQAEAKVDMAGSIEQLAELTERAKRFS